ncbi:hypothetical protein [Pelagibius sp. Alg239-R121]|uniref:hypothetical protein n=1 Tax=Pelagibius sp. Alg239-R121 TaxID=2993448 RepID=UPI0024A6E224|nr:hypothetical protein [Pelagibius sp. Alg239-R121]
MRITYVVVFTFIGLLLSGCAPAFFKYRYISIEDVEGIEILEYGKSDVGNLFFHGDMPVSYLLKRGSYNLKFDVDTGTHLPTMKVGVFSEAAEVPFSLQAGDHTSKSIGVAFDYPNGLPVNALRFGPSYEYRFRERETYTVVFDVVDSETNMIAREAVEFRLETNGIYYEIDAL